MYYELIILGSLLLGPAHGYLIAKIVQNITGPYDKVSSGRLYPLLAKLEAQGLIVAEPGAEKEATSQSRRYQLPSRGYRITDSGRARFHHLMMDTTSYLGDYKKVFVQKVAHFSFLLPSERRHLVDHYIGYCRTLVSHGMARVEAITGAVENNPDVAVMHLTSEQVGDLLAVMHHTIDQWQQELRWAEGLRDPNQPV
ncbi:MAG: helix-turn-helix transcriptional regulator [Chloroflexia bacterium]